MRRIRLAEQLQETSHSATRTQKKTVLHRPFSASLLSLSDVICLVGPRNDEGLWNDDSAEPGHDEQSNENVIEEDGDLSYAKKSQMRVA
jgi:hypothetical protein